jgi:hypothetical protein
MYSDASLGLSSHPTVSAALEYNDNASSGYFVSKSFAAFSNNEAADSGLPPLQHKNLTNLLQFEH